MRTEEHLIQFVRVRKGFLELVLILSMHGWLLHGFGIVILSNYNGQTFAKLRCSVRRRQLYVSSQNAPEETGGAEGRQEG